jgi:DUF438 domain-containing protein
MKLGPDTKIRELIDTYPFLKEFLVQLNPHFASLQNPLLWKTVGRFATLTRVAVMGGVPLPDLLTALAGEIRAKTGAAVPVEGEAQAAASREETLKGIIRDLHRTENVGAAKERFRELIKDVAPWEIGKMEQSLMQEGLPEAEVKRLCSVHVEVFKESLEHKTVPGLPAGHPVHQLMRENREAERIAAELEGIADPKADAPKAAALLERLAEIDRHYLRKENQLFPVLETKGFSGPSKVMWAVHDDIRALVKDARANAPAGKVTAQELAFLATQVRDMVYKEEHILFPAALEMLTEEDWVKVAAGEEEIGYAWVPPEQRWRPAGLAAPAEYVARHAGTLTLDTGQLTAEQVNLLLTHLPVDISFVNENDEVLYYSATPERIFPRSPGVIGRRVQNCHPPKSVGTVEKILGEFKAGRKDQAEFWIQMRGRFLHIRYFAVRDAAGTYRGCLEVSQDVTGIRALEGEQRLLDWSAEAGAAAP